MSDVREPAESVWLAVRPERGRDGGPGIRAADDPDIEVLAAILVERRGNGKKHDPFRRTEARRGLLIIREFLRRTDSHR